MPIDHEVGYQYISSTVTVGFVVLVTTAGLVTTEGLGYRGYTTGKLAPFQSALALL